MSEKLKIKIAVAKTSGFLIFSVGTKSVAVGFDFADDLLAELRRLRRGLSADIAEMSADQKAGWPKLHKAVAEMEKEDRRAARQAARRWKKQEQEDAAKNGNGKAPGSLLDHVQEEQARAELERRRERNRTAKQRRKKGR